jgi:uncharacterized protein (TIGR03435 family)
VVAALVGVPALIIAVFVGSLRVSSRASAEWMEFSIGPASGRSSSIQADALRSTGMTLRAMVATAYDVPSVRVIGPAWLADSRYSVRAVVGPEKAESFRLLLQQELENRLRLKAHLERRPFEVLVLHVVEGSRLVGSKADGPSVWIGDQQARMQGADMQTLAGTLQSVLGQPVLDETGLRGWYDLELGWSTDRLASVRTALQEQYGLQLSPARREMDALIVDRIRRDAALVVLSNIGRVMESAPPTIRQGIADILTIR